MRNDLGTSDLDNVAKVGYLAMKKLQNSVLTYKVICALCLQVDIWLMGSFRQAVVRLCERTHHRNVL
jgi:hypothetical protein